MGQKKGRTYVAQPPDSGAKDGIRTRDPDLGKVVLYQLSYFRIGIFSCENGMQIYKKINFATAG